MSHSINIAARCRARRFALQAAYQWHMAATEFDALLQQYQAQFAESKVDEDYFQQLLSAVVNQQVELDHTFSSYLDRPLDQLSPIELAILRLASYELVNRLEIPYRVVINEWIQLAKKFGATEGHKYVNAILDKMAREKRPQEHTS